MNRDSAQGGPKHESPHIWHPLTEIPRAAAYWGNRQHEGLEHRWRELREKLTDHSNARAYLDGWLLERRRAFAIENGQIENLYTLRRGVTEQLITEGFEGVRASHSVEGVDDQTLRGLLKDQHDALEMVFDDVKSARPLTGYTIRSWHQLLTRHQKTVPAITPFGQQIEVPFERKGQWKIKSNNPRCPDGVIHEYCPPEQVAREMERLFTLHEKAHSEGYPVEVEAAWLHHRFVRTHPFQDGNGRVSRLLMAWCYVKRGLPPPIISAQEKPEYIARLESADRGNLRSFAEFIAFRAIATVGGCIAIADDALAGHLERTNGNGGRTIGEKYFPPGGQGQER